MKALIRGAAGAGVQIALIVLGAGSLLVFARDGFHVFLHDLFNWLVFLVESLLGFLDLPAIQRILRALLDAVEAWAARFGIELDLVLQTHWKHASVLLWLVFGSHAQALADFAARPWASGLRNAAAAGAATAGGLMAGTVHLGHPGVLWWPACALLLYLALNALLHGATAQRGRRRIVPLLGAIVLAAGAVGLAGFALAIDPLAVLGSASPSEGLRIVILAATALGLLAVVFGFGRKRASDGEARVHWAGANPGRRMGLRVLATLGLAAVVAGASQAAWAIMRPPGAGVPQAIFRDCPGCPEMVRLPAGRFSMGTSEGQKKSQQYAGLRDFSPPNEFPAHEVSIRAFAIARTETTLAEFRSFAEATGYRPSGICFGGEDFSFDPRVNWRAPGFAQTPDHPVVCMTWWDAQAYVRWLSLGTGEAYRLPSEAEWEYAARGGTTTLYFWGDNPDDGCAFANGADATTKRANSNPEWKALSCDDGALRAAPVGAYRPNSFGLHDMIGNVWEWVEDCYKTDYSGLATDGSANVSEGCSNRVLRGGSWYNTPQHLRSANRLMNSPSMRRDELGFRVARTHF